MNHSHSLIEKLSQQMALAPESERRLPHPSVQRFLLKILRHDFEDASLVVDEQGWASVDDLMRLAEQNLQDQPGWTGLDRHSLECLVRGEHGRIEMEKGKIRARYGHSRAMVSGTMMNPPAQLLHATESRLVPRILEIGLLPSGRHLVHLTSDAAYAHDIGCNGDEPISLLSVETESSLAAGCRFYRATDHVWQTHFVPPISISVLRSTLRDH